MMPSPVRFSEILEAMVAYENKAAHANAMKQWGKNGNHLFGVPVICDADSPRWWLEVEVSPTRAQASRVSDDA